MVFSEDEVGEDGGRGGGRGAEEGGGGREAEKTGMPSLRALRSSRLRKSPDEETALRDEKGSPQGHTASKWMSKD